MYRAAAKPTHLVLAIIVSRKGVLIAPGSSVLTCG